MLLTTTTDTTNVARQYLTCHIGVIAMVMGYRSQLTRFRNHQSIGPSGVCEHGSRHFLKHGAFFEFYAKKHKIHNYLQHWLSDMQKCLASAPPSPDLRFLGFLPPDPTTVTALDPAGGLTSKPPSSPSPFQNLVSVTDWSPNCGTIGIRIAENAQFYDRFSQIYRVLTETPHLTLLSSDHL